MFADARVPSYVLSPVMPACSDPTDTVSLALIQVACSAILSACTVSHNSMTHCSAVVIFFCYHHLNEGILNVFSFLKWLSDTLSNLLVVYNSNNPQHKKGIGFEDFCNITQVLRMYCGK